MFSNILKLEAFKTRDGKTGHEVSCISIRLQNQPIKLNTTSNGDIFLNAKINDQLRVIVSERCDVTCVIMKHGQHSSTLSTASVLLKPGHDFVSCKQDSKDYLKFHLFVQDANKFFNQATFVDRNNDNFILKCSGGFYTKNVTLRANEKIIDLPYDPLSGFLMDKRIYSNQTFYQCGYGTEKISFLYYANRNTYDDIVEYKMQMQSFTIKFELQCIIDGTQPRSESIKAVLACSNNVDCPELEQRLIFDSRDDRKIRLASKTIFAASLPKTNNFNPNYYTCVFIANGKVEALARIPSYDFSVQFLVNLILGVAVFIAFFVLIVNQFAVWNYVKLVNNQVYEFDESKLSMEESTVITEGNSSEIRLMKFIPTGQDVIIKFSQHVWQFKREYKMLNSMKHPNILTAYGYVNLPNKKSRLNVRIHHLVLPYYPKTCLEKFIRRFYPVRRIQNEFHSKDNTTIITLFDLVSFGWQISQALKYLKEQGITHRDVAMRNVLITDDFICKLTDFERAKKWETHDISIATQLFKFFTINDSDVPTMYPAECRSGAYFYESEVYCFGLLLLEMFSFLKPTEPNSKFPPPQPMNCPTPIYSMILECLTANRKQRISMISCESKLSMAAHEYGGQRYADMKTKLKKEESREFLEELLNKKVEYEPVDPTLIPIFIGQPNIN